VSYTPSQVAELERENAELRATLISTPVPPPAAPAPAATMEDRRTAFARSRLQSLSVSSGGGSAFSLTMDSIKNIFSTNSGSPGGQNGSFFSNTGGSFFSNTSNSGSGERSPTARASLGEAPSSPATAAPSSESWGLLGSRPSADLWASMGFGSPAPAPAAPAAPPAARFVGDFGEDPLSPVDEEDASDRSRKLRRLSRPGSGL